LKSCCRKYGKPPYTVAVVHGGPGAAGSVAPLARELGSLAGTLEPLQTERTLEGQLEELARTLQQEGRAPLTVIGHSWGAWLGWLLAATYPALVAKLILVCAGPFEEHYAAAITATRLAHLTAEEGREYQRLLAVLGSGAAAGGEAELHRLGQLAAKADACERIADEAEDAADRIAADSRAIYEGVWPAAARLRQSGKLLALAGAIRCPVLAIHGRNDPHPAEGVRAPLARCLADFRMVVLDRCGHEPWRERHGRDAFFRLLKTEITPRAR
jgi:pimeloyl-ACP methyl ester carboxylesterase